MTNYEFDLGSYTRPITTSSSNAQIWFDRALMWCYGFNHDEAVRCFEHAAQADPGCAIAHWGVAYAVGPNYNMQWDAFAEGDAESSCKKAYESTRKALELKSNASPVEQALIDALLHRYPSVTPSDDFNIWNDDYANAMREVHKQFPDDWDVCTLFSDALMNRTPWALWDFSTGQPAEGADTLEAAEVLETAIAAVEANGEPPHAGLLHMYIHLMEMSPHPQKALKAGDALLGLAPDAGHLEHMPTHIDVLCGHYQDVVERNHVAVLADRKFLDKEGPLNFYTTYRCHDIHFKLYGAMFLGQKVPALDAANELVNTLTESVLNVESPPMAEWAEAFVPMKVHVLIRFGLWNELIDAPLPSNPELFCSTLAMWHYGKCIAYANTKSIEAAKAERDHYYEALAQVPNSRFLFNNAVIDILKIATEMLEGELAYHQQDYDNAFAHLRKAVELDDNMPYDEPWAWMQPARHALGALLLEQGHFDEAEAVYRADLGFDASVNRASQHPNNVWSLYGLHECLQRQGKTDEARLIKVPLDIALARTDVPLKASCFCANQHSGAAFNHTRKRC